MGPVRFDSVARARVLRVGSLVVAGVATIWLVAAIAWSYVYNPVFGLDYRWHVDAAQRLLETGSPYYAWQVSGPYEIGNGAILYPPTAFVLFLPFTVLPAVLWWVIPCALLAWGIAAHRPPPWALAVIMVVLALQAGVFVFGNPGMWTAAFLAMGTVYGWPAVLVLLKPTFAPFAAVGITRRSWWIAALALVIAGLPFGLLWLDWIRVVTNSNCSLAYSLPQVPFMVVPLIAWLTGHRRPRATRPRSD